MFKDNLIRLRRLRGMTQEALAAEVGVSRQAVAKWESGESVPDLERSRKLAQIFAVSLDDLAGFESEEHYGLPLPPKGKHLFGLVTVGDKGQIVIPARARRLFAIAPGDQLMVLGDEAQGLALMKADSFLAFARQIRDAEE